MPMTTSQRQDAIPIALLVVLPLLLAFPELAGTVHTDPLLHAAAIVDPVGRSLVRGEPFIDPNGGFTTQALGTFAASEWLHWHVPWWNPYSGVGLPLAGEYQPAAFFPLTALLLLAKGMIWQRIILQALAGCGAYLLLRGLVTSRLAAFAGAMLYGFNGTLAVFNHGPAQVAPFVPWMLAGIERIQLLTRHGKSGGWKLMAASLALLLLAGFPESAYLAGLLALCLAILRGSQLPAGLRTVYGARIMAGGVCGLALAAPQLLAFFSFLPLADIGQHGGALATSAYDLPYLVPSLIAPYIWGPIFGYVQDWPDLYRIWGAIGGYVTIAALALAAYGFVARRDAIAWLLVVWSMIALGRTFGLEPFLSLVDVIPGIAHTWFDRYVQPTWELAVAILAARGIDAMVRGGNGAALRAALLTCAAAGVAFLTSAAIFAPLTAQSPGLRGWLLGSGVWAMATASLCIAGLRHPSSRTARLLVLLLVIDSGVMATIPKLSATARLDPELGGVRFLQEHLGLQRFYTLHPLQPNYGAYFSIASINHNYLPVSRRWTDWVSAHLDRGADAIVFNGSYARPNGMPSAAEELRRNLESYREVAVKYVVFLRVADPWAAPDDPIAIEARRVYEDSLVRIYELAHPAPYFEASGPCDVRATDRLRVQVSCRQPARLIRRELYFPGWTATINGQSAPISPHEGLFQAIDVPDGRAEIRYSYAPPGAGWAWAACLAGIVALLFPFSQRVRISPRTE